MFGSESVPLPGTRKRNEPSLPHVFWKNPSGMDDTDGMFHQSKRVLANVGAPKSIVPLRLFQFGTSTMNMSSFVLLAKQ
jgi:hypothetical protein